MTNRLKGQQHLAGAMDRVPDRGGWREHITPVLKH